MNRELRVLIADDHPIFRQGLRQIIETDPGLKVVAEAADGVSGHMPDLSGVANVNRLEYRAADLLSNDLAALAVDISNNHGRALRGKRMCTGTADARRGASDDRDLAG